ncbi:8711_t:CDS:2 [Diversispora eburnea]|uniref:8711_t:CDS:1 n=1 Tax=Diversispora eburnea TaxID=1213867 RepID=A0A9N9A0R7_9GLOM|nr:8711_t:CDS:2 [Diversispora eburnea]
MFMWAGKPCFFIVKATKKKIGRIGSAVDFENELKRLNDYINLPPGQRKLSLPTRRWDPVISITGFRNLTDARRFEIFVENTFRSELPIEEISDFKQFKSEEFPPCVYKRIVIARKLFREFFTEKLPVEQPKIWKKWEIHWSPKLSKELLKQAQFGWDIEEFRKTQSFVKVSDNDDNNKNQEQRYKTKLYTIQHKIMKFDDFVPWDDILKEWRELKGEKKHLDQHVQIKMKKERLPFRELRSLQPPPPKDHWFKVIDDDE